MLSCRVFFVVIIYSYFNQTIKNKSLFFCLTGMAIMYCSPLAALKLKVMRPFERPFNHINRPTVIYWQDHVRLTDFLLAGYYGVRWVFYDNPLVVSSSLPTTNLKNNNFCQLPCWNLNSDKSLFSLGLLNCLSGNVSNAPVSKTNYSKTKITNC